MTIAYKLGRLTARVKTAAPISPETQSRINEAQKKLFITMFPNKDTPVTDLMASPAKRGLMGLGGGGAAGGTLGFLAGRRLGGKGWGRVGAAALGVPMGMYEGLGQLIGTYRKNKGLEEAMHRFGPAATLQDYEDLPSRLRAQIQELQKQVASSKSRWF